MSWCPPTEQSFPSEFIIDRDKKRRFKLGFLGPTSHLESFTADVVDIELDTNSAEAVSYQQIEVGAQILSLLEQIPYYLDLVSERYKLFKGWIFPPQTVFLALEQLSATYGKITDHSRARKKYSRLLNWSQSIFRNTASRLYTHPQMTLMEYVTVLSQRWEIIGMIFALIGTATYQLAHDIHIFHREGIPGGDRYGLRNMAMATSEMCIQFCSSMGIITEPFCWAAMQHTVFVAEMHGCRGNVTSLVFALGLHNYYPDVTASPLIEEIRKRTMAAAYALDKDVSMVVGRPPRICWRYCNIKYPLDVAWDDLVSNYETAVQRLDFSGWNTDGDLERGSKPRIALLVGIIQEKVLEVLLNDQPIGLEEKIKEICLESSQIRVHLPSYLQWSPQTKIPSVISLHLEFLYQDFLMYRSLVNQTSKGSGMLVSTSLDILSILLDWISNEAGLGRISPCSISAFRFIGLPVAGVLSTELFRHFQTPFDPAAETMFPRSTITKMLSDFATHLQTISLLQEGGNDLYFNERVYICRVLDQVLSHRPRTQFEPNKTGECEITCGHEGLMEDINLMELLDHFEWDPNNLLFSN
uniref:Putative transcriptional regulatory protein n=1 Tax=Talaromyces marneffei PM1 TaxID=1077442 RepID=A0A093X9Y8_TALMA